MYLIGFFLFLVHEKRKPMYRGHNKPCYLTRTAPCHPQKEQISVAGYTVQSLLMYPEGTYPCSGTFNNSVKNQKMYPEALFGPDSFDSEAYPRKMVYIIFSFDILAAIPGKC